jgi:hypothetical protein
MNKILALQINIAVILGNLVTFGAFRHSVKGLLHLTPNYISVPGKYTRS